jgi:hypothetical protein
MTRSQVILGHTIRVYVTWSTSFRHCAYRRLSRSDTLSAVHHSTPCVIALIHWAHALAYLVEALRCKLEGRGFNLPNPSSRTTVLARKADNLTAICEPTVYTVSQLHRPPRPITGIHLPLSLSLTFIFQWRSGAHVEGRRRTLLKAPHECDSDASIFSFVHKQLSLIQAPLTNIPWPNTSLHKQIFAEVGPMNAVHVFTASIFKSVLI